MIVVGGVGQLYQGDLDFARVAAERLQAEELGREVLVEDFHYGAVAVAQRLEELRPHTLILIGAASRGRPTGTVQRLRLEPSERAPADVQGSVSDAVVGYVDMDLVINVAAGFGVLPQRTVAIEFEPVLPGPSEKLSAEAEAALEPALELVRAEVRRAPLFQLADEIRERLSEAHLEPASAVEALEALLGELETLEREGRWARTFAERDRLRLLISTGGTGEGMDHLDWGQWWALLEELDRLEQTEARVE